MGDTGGAMTTNAGDETRRDRVRAWKAACLDWRANEGVALLFVAKALAASAIALWIGFRLDLENPRWSVVSIFIVMQPESGLVLEKGFYRILATLIGCVVSLVMVAAFAQYAELFLGVLALWLGLCVACSLRFRNYQAYAWALAGYTATIVGLPAAFGNPDGAFAMSVARATEIGVGVACAGLVGALVFPRTSEARLRRQTRERFAEFMPHALGVLRRADAHEADAEARRRLLDGLAEQDSAMSAAAFENPHRPDFVVRVRRLNRSFVRLATRIHLLLHLRRRIRAHAGTDADAVLDAQAALLPGTPDVARLKDVRDALLRATPPVSPDIEAHTRLLAGYAEDLAAHVRLFDQLEKPLPAGDPGEPPYVTTRIDRGVASVAGLRAALTVALLGAFWIGTEWPDGVMAIMCAMIASALCAASPDPVAMMGRALGAFLYAIPAGLLFRFGLMPEAHDFTVLFACLAPFLALSAYWIARPRHFLTGLFFSVWFLTLAGPENNPEPDLAVFFGQSLAGLAGIGLGLVLFAVVTPGGVRRVRRRERRGLRRLVMTLCLDDALGHSGRFDHEVRVALRRIAGNRAAGAGDGDHDRVMRWSYAALEIGGAMAAFREKTDERTAPREKAAALRVRRAVAEAFRAPSATALRDAVTAVEDAAAVFAGEAGTSGADLYLHLMRTALLDPDSPLAGDDDATPLEPEARHA